MSSKLILPFAGLVLAAYAVSRTPHEEVKVVPVPVQPAPDTKKPDKHPRLPHPLNPQAAPGKPVEGGRVAPDGTTEVKCDLPRELRKKNIASSGLGCCVFRSTDYAGHWQHEPEVYDLPEKMVKAGIPGGGYPEKYDKVLKQLAPHVKYVQDTSGDPEVLKAILASGRIACVTYNGSDCHYSGHIDHMVCLVHFDDKWACVSDNNFIEENQFVWMSPDEFVKRWKGSGGGWVVCLLSPPPPPVPHN